MNLNLSKFKKISDDSKAAILQHPQGHQITIAKKALSPEMQKELSSLPLHYDEGGSVSSSDNSSQANASVDPSVSAPPPPPQQQQPVNVVINNTPQPQQQQQPAPADVPIGQKLGQFAQQGGRFAGNLVHQGVEDAIAPYQAVANTAMKAGRGFVQGFNQEPDSQALPTAQANIQNATANMPSANSGQAPAQPSMPQAAAGSNDPYGMNAYLNAYQRGINEQRAGIGGEAQALGQQGQAQSDVLGQGLQAQQAQMKSYQDHYNELDQERKNFMTDVQNQHIDPKHFLNSMGTGQKIATGIGLILGGMGGGLMHQQNPALQFLNDQINRDIDAQKTNLGKSENLLNANMKQFGNLRDATDMTRVMQMDIVSNQLKQAAAQAMNPIAKARALQAAGQLDMQAAPVLSQIAMRKTLMNSMQNPNGGNGITQTLDMLRITNPELAKNYESRYVPSVGLAQVPVPEKARDEMVARSNLDQSIGELRNFAQLHAGTVLDRATVAEGSAKARLVQDAYRRANAQGVFREAEKNFVEGIVDQDPTKFFNSWRTEPKYRALENDNMRQLNGLKQGYGLPQIFVPPSGKPFPG